MRFFNKNEEENNESRIVKDIKTNLVYMLNEEYKEAFIIDSYSSDIEFIIPYSFKESKLLWFFTKEYFITTISKKSFETSYIKSIRFPTNSLVTKIEKSAFSNSTIKSIYFPRNLTTLSDGWCKNTEYLIDVQIDPQNDFYSMQNGLLIGMNKMHDYNRKNLLFANRNIKKAVIPSNVHHICPYAFENCTELETVEFESSFSILTIGKYAFKKCSSLKKFILPYKIEKIEKFTFSECFDYMKSFDFDNFSNLKIIGKGAFMNSRIEKITLPSSVTKIGKFAFRSCQTLKEFNIYGDHHLETIGKKAFCDTCIKSLCLPAKFKELKDGWCDSTCNLKMLLVHDNDRYSVYKDLIIGKSDAKSDIFDTLVFAPRNIKSVVIPSFIKFISPCAVQYCNEIEYFDIQSNSELKTIGERAFANSTIDKFVLPSCAVKIAEDAFNSCDKLKYFRIENNSKLQVIENGAFKCSSIVCFTIPSCVTKIGKSVFYYCENLEIVEIDEDISLSSIELSELINIVSTIIMVPAKLKNNVC